MQHLKLDANLLPLESREQCRNLEVSSNRETFSGSTLRKLVMETSLVNALMLQLDQGGVTKEIEI